ncbi:MAG: ribosomal L7Ae/L30e/S12e/Gadd45 family protein [Candidatus Woesearchaeota archaeon]
MAHIDDIRKLLNTKKLIIGTDRSMKNLKIGKLSKIYVSKNCPNNIKEDIKYYGGLAGTEVIELEETNEELGIACKKPFFISVVSVLK